MGRAPCCDKANVKKGPWSPEEDAKLKEYIEKYGTGGNWIALPQKVGLKRCGKSCRLRWLNYLRPNIKHGEFSDEEDRIICTLFANIGSRWSIIAAQLPGRTDNDIKNYWNTKLKKKLMGFVQNNPQYNNIPHRKFMISPPFQNSSQHKTSTSLSHHQTQLLMPSSSFCKDLHYTNSCNFFQNSNRSLSNNTMIMNNDPSLGSTNSSSYDLSFQSQDHSLVGVNDCVQYCYPVKDNINSNNLLVFGSGSNEGSCSTSSDGSCNYQIKQEEMGFHRQTQSSFVGLLNNINSYGGNSIGDNHDHNNGLNLMWGQQSSGYFGGTVLDDQDRDYQFSSSSCVLEDVKQAISTTSCGNVGSNNFTSFFMVDENKTQENSDKVMFF